jgi:16S rRNA (cytosine1402-N4)-methyltransferase
MMPTTANTEWMHTTVLLAQTVDALLGDSSPDVAHPRTFIDATYGRGGHTRLLLSRVGDSDKLIAFDRDAEAVAHAQTLAAADARFSIRHAAFSQMSDIAPASIAGVMLDLGISSPQVDNADRGFSFMRDGPLDMRMDTTSGQSVAQWLQTASESTISEVIHDYGEERHARRIAAAIVASRAKNKNGEHSLTRTLELAQLVAGCVPREAGQHPATRTFQAFRIFINDELGEIERALAAALDLLAPGGRLAVISFHSLEDRRVKQFIAKHSKEVFDPRSPQSLMRNADSTLPLKDLGRIKPSNTEVKSNPRSRSAVLRVAERSKVAL